MPSIKREGTRHQLPQVAQRFPSKKAMNRGHWTQPTQLGTNEMVFYVQNTSHLSTSMERCQWQFPFARMPFLLP
ncbi:hypothetical protein MRX96_018396 [Rhipicephalus microplus]